MSELGDFKTRIDSYARAGIDTGVLRLLHDMLEVIEGDDKGNKQMKNDKEIEAVARALLKADKVMPLDDWAYTMAKAAISALDKVRGDKRSNQNEQ